MIAHLKHTLVALCAVTTLSNLAHAQTSEENPAITLPAKREITDTDGQLPTASYRWRYRKSPTAEIQSGTGSIKASYTLVTLEGGGRFLQHNPDHQIDVKTGGLIINWDNASGFNAKDYKPCLSYYARKGTLETLPAENFDQPF
jgi:hypothetical protein